MNPRSILVLTHELPPFGGGAGRAVAELCRALHSRGVTITVWTQKPPPGKERPFPFGVRYFSTGRKAQFQTSYVSVLFFSLRILISGLLLKRDKTDLIFSNIAIPAGFIGALLARIMNVPHVIWYHGADVHGNRKQGAGAFMRLLLKIAWLKTDLHCFVSKGLLSMTERFGANRAPRELLPLFADYMVPGQSAPVEQKVFLMAGRLENEKNPLLLLDAIELLRTRGLLPLNVRFKLIGGGSLFPLVQKRIAEAGLSSIVALHASVPPETMNTVYRRSYALVLTSLVEGFPLTVLEAAMCGVPAIGPDTLGVNEVIRNGRTGIIFSADDAEACAQTILALAQNEELRNALGIEAEKEARKLTADRSAALFLDMAKKYL